MRSDTLYIRSDDVVLKTVLPLRCRQICVDLVQRLTNILLRSPSILESVANRMLTVNKKFIAILRQEFADHLCINCRCL